MTNKNEQEENTSTAQTLAAAAPCLGKALGYEGGCLIYQIAPLFVLALDCSGTVIFSNELATKTLKTNPVGKNWFESFVPNEQREEHSEAFRGALEQRYCTRPFKEYRLTDAEGAPYTMLWHEVVLTDKNAEPTGVLVAAIDITERKILEEDFSKFKCITDNATYGSVILNEKQEFIYVNKAFAQMYGYERDELLGHNVTDFVAPQYRGEFIAKLEDLRETGRLIGMRVIHLRKDGLELPTLLHASIIELQTGKKAYAATIIDITNEVKSERKLRESEEQLLGISTSIPGVVYQLTRKADGSYLVTYIGPAVERVLNIGTNPPPSLELILEHVDPCDRSRIIEQLERSAATLDTCVQEFKLYSKLGKLKWLRAVASPRRVGEDIVWNGVCTDISDLKQTELTLIDRNRYLKASHDISKIAAKSETVEEGCQEITEIIASVMQVPIVSVELYHPETKTMRFVSVSGGCKDIVGLEVDLQDTISGTVVKEKVPAIVKNAEEHPCYRNPSLKSLNIKTFICFPLQLGEEVVGALSLAIPKTIEVEEPLLFWTSSIANEVASLIRRKRAEKALKQSEERFRTFFEHCPLGIALVEPSTLRILTANDPFCELVEYPLDELTSLTIRDITPPEEFEKERRNISLARAGATQKFSLEKHYITKSGTLKLVRLVANLLSITGSSDIVAIGIAEDITEKRQAEESLRERDATLASIFSASPIGIGLSRNGRIERVNEQLCQMLGFELKELEGQSERALYASDEDYAQILEFEQDNLEKYGKGSIQTRWQRKDGKMIRVDFSCALLDLSNRSNGFTFTGLDITKQKKAERENFLHQEKLRALAGALADAEERERMRIATGLHDSVAQTLALCRIKIGMLGQQKECSESNRTALKDVTSLLEQAISEIRTLTFEISPPVLYELGFVATIEWLCERFQSKTKCRCQVIEEFDVGSISRESSTILFQAFRELLTNIEKHAKATKVTVTISERNGKATLAVEDDGIGFSKRWDETSPWGSLKGFGLFNIKERLKLVGGTMDVTSTPNKGTLVTLSIPPSLEGWKVDYSDPPL